MISMKLGAIIGAIGVLAPVALAAPYVQATRTTLETRQNCHSAENRACWDSNFDISSDYYKSWPAGTTTTYTFEVTQQTQAPDGVPRVVMAVNGQIPGPTIEAQWGDTVVVHVKNSLELNGTSIHFHGIRQLETNDEDGTIGITQCPTAPEQSITYTWKATQYGTSWYHSHFGTQAWNGVFGPIVIHGPASQNYDVDLGPVILSDWTWKTTDELHKQGFAEGSTSVDNGLINGKMKSKDGGVYANLTFTPNLTHRLRFVNTAIDTFYHVSLEDHDMTVIATDFVAVEPFTIPKGETLRIAIGQRYDVLVKASATPKDYWLRTFFGDCGRTYTEDGPADKVKAVVRYDPAGTTVPPEPSPLPADQSWRVNYQCDDMEAAKLKPVLKLKFADQGASNHVVEWSQDSATIGEETEVRWHINGSEFRVEWNDPTLLQLNKGLGTFKPQQQVIQLPQEKNRFVKVIITISDVGHPIHLHGHDFFILRQDPVGFDPTDTTPTSDNPPRRDTAMLPLVGRLILGFETDNPGAWLMHCHIGWHAAQGFALQFHERTAELTDPNSPARLDAARLTDTCTKWDEWAKLKGIVQNDQGI